MPLADVMTCSIVSLPSRLLDDVAEWMESVNMTKLTINRDGERVKLEYAAYERRCVGRP